VLKIATSSGRWTPFCNQIESFLSQDITELVIDGMPVRGYRSPDNPALWIRDHSDIARGGKYFEPSLKSPVDAFAASQAANGRVFDYVTSKPLPWTGERENWERWVRIPVEADVEYRFVNAAFEAWQASGDDAWIESHIPAMERALQYTTTHPWRWDEDLELVKRAFTMDTWDFDYTAGRHPWLNFQITPHTLWGVMHGDNSGLYGAAQRLSLVYSYMGQHDEADRWSELASGVRERSNKLLYNGSFYRHFHKITPFELRGVDEDAQLSLSNPMDINRGLATHDIASSILIEYQRRRREGDSFAEWFSIDPPFPQGFWGEETLVQGAYINGGIFPLVGGELARAALEHGFEDYGVEILDQYREMIEKTGETYLWYFPDGSPSSVEASTSPEATATDGWGSSAMLYAFVEGLCGVTDLLHSFLKIRFSPRWIAAGESSASVEVTYGESGASFAYEYSVAGDARRPTEMKFNVRAADTRMTAHILIPDGARVARVTVNGSAVEYVECQVGDSNYVDFVSAVDGSAAIGIELPSTTNG
jgi:hypothetical protein